MRPKHAFCGTKHWEEDEGTARPFTPWVELEYAHMRIDRVCLLDPKARGGLSPEDGDGRFDMFLFGGILGDDPPRDRTAELRVMGFPTRHLGPVQMTTDTALGVTKLVIKDKKPISEIPYAN
ncbi:putative predicted SAM-dependent RNA methyltransferase [Lyophyllum shimeji]|uniref:Predicted SAM-dependent RNA methyltransferase n=1 Tax=Lyophyllum shimeji TaxID=47721 RepID=A0A9P3ULR9_LYOSH|nr:putative predicted SAM-dependent RNA methyltransferase [Lyophyllum shimeji]